MYEKKKGRTQKLQYWVLVGFLFTASLLVFSMSLAAGCAVRESKKDTADSLFKRADAQMYERKQKMKEKFVQNRL